MAVERVDYTGRVLRRGQGADPVCNRPVNIDGGEGSEQTQGASRGVQNHLGLHAGSGNKTVFKLNLKEGPALLSPPSGGPRTAKQS